VCGIANNQKKPEVSKALGEDPLLFFSWKKSLTEFAAYRPGISKCQTEDLESFHSVRSLTDTVTSPPTTVRCHLLPLAFAISVLRFVPQRRSSAQKNKLTEM
jgi:hypothetical protein